MLDSQYHMIPSASLGEDLEIFQNGLGYFVGTGTAGPKKHHILFSHTNLSFFFSYWGVFAF